MHNIAVYVFPKDPPPDPLATVEKILETIGRKRTGYHRYNLVVDEIPEDGSVLILGTGDNVARLLVTEVHLPFMRLAVGDSDRLDTFGRDAGQPIKILAEEV